LAHPFAAHRQNKVEHARVAHIAKGYAAGGGVHDDAAEDRKMVKHMVKKTALRASGGPVTSRMDRTPRRAKGGKVGRKGKTTVNVVVGHPGSGGPSPMPMVPPVVAGPPRPPVAPPMPPPGLAPGLPPGGPGLPMGPRKGGGRTYAKGGAVKDGPAWNEGRRNGTQVQHSDGKDDGKDIGRGKPITYRTGGRIEHIAGTAGMGPKLPGGGGGGEARLAKQSRARCNYAKPKGGHG
jgi:hypothetical protein